MAYTENYDNNLVICEKEIKGCGMSFFLYLRDGSAMDLSVAVESCNKLGPAPCSQDPNGLFIATLLLFYSIMKNFSLRLCQFWIDLITNIPICGHQPH